MNIAAIFKAVDAAVAIRNAMRKPTARPGPRPVPERSERPERSELPELSAMTGVMVAALKEAFNRDQNRLDLERRQLEDQNRRAEEALKLEVRRQAADRELARLRMLAGTALAAWFASIATAALFFPARLPATIAMAAGCVLLLMALAFAFMAQARVCARAADTSLPMEVSSSLPVWLLVAGLATTAASVLMR